MVTHTFNPSTQEAGAIRDGGRWDVEFRSQTWAPRWSLKDLNMVPRSNSGDTACAVSLPIRMALRLVVVPSMQSWVTRPLQSLA